jgi:hypothetical protein
VRIESVPGLAGKKRRPIGGGRKRKGGKGRRGREGRRREGAVVRGVDWKSDCMVLCLFCLSHVLIFLLNS